MDAQFLRGSRAIPFVPFEGGLNHRLFMAAKVFAGVRLTRPGLACSQSFEG